MRYIAVTSFVVTLVHSYDQSIADCEAFATAMGSTCDSEIDTSTTAVLDATVDGTLTCTGDASWCVGTSQSDATETSCTHDYLMCITCFTALTGKVRIRVQSNNMPNKCWESSSANPNVGDYVTVDFSTTWNPDMTGIENYTAEDFDT